MYKIRLRNGNFYANKSGRVQHYLSPDEARRKIKRLGARAAGARVVESSKKGAPKGTRRHGTKGKGKGRSGKGKSGRRHKRTKDYTNEYGGIISPYMM